MSACSGREEFSPFKCKVIICLELEKDWQVQPLIFLGDQKRLTVVCGNFKLLERKALR